MEQMVELLTNSENVRMLVIIAVSLCGFMKLNMSFDKRFYALDKKIDDKFGFLDKKIDGVEASLSKRIDGVEASLNKRIDGVEASILELKNNDIAHLNYAIKALTFTLEKNKFLEKEDKEYIDGVLDN